MAVSDGFTVVFDSFVAVMQSKGPAQWLGLFLSLSIFRIADWESWSAKFFSAVIVLLSVACWKISGAGY